jgi:peptidoglycan/xylan/chitin deacetylase (PgdA/CDA1 family)
MEGGLHPGRLGAGALVLAAMLALTQALNGCQTSPPLPLVTVRSAVLRPIAAALPERRRQVFRPHLPAFPSQTPAMNELIPAGRVAVNVPILMYHYIRVNPDPRDRLGFGLSVTPADFEAQMTWLAANGYHPIDLQDLERYLGGARSLPPRPVVLTFDDGYEDFYTTAYPVLRSHHFTAVSYVVTGFLGAPRYMTVAQVIELDAAGIEIGAHTVTHADLTRLAAANMRHEVADSRAMLEGLLKHPVVDFCYPSGKVNAAVVLQVEVAGFRSATTTAAGTTHSLGDRFSWTRVRVAGGESLADFVQRLGPEEPAVLVAPAPHSLLNLAAQQ